MDDLRNTMSYVNGELEAAIKLADEQWLSAY